MEQLRKQHVFMPCLDYLQALERLQERLSPDRDVLTELRDEMQTLRYLERVAHDADGEREVKINELSSSAQARG